jgi:hypothetical protein
MSRRTGLGTRLSEKAVAWVHNSTKYEELWEHKLYEQPSSYLLQHRPWDTYKLMN